jgi:hypothetical protein
MTTLEKFARGQGIEAVRDEIIGDAYVFYKFFVNWGGKMDVS